MSARDAAAFRAHARETWAAVLDVEVCDDTDFFDAGGQSFAAVRIVSGLSERLGTRIALATLFEHSVFAEFICAVAEGLPAEQAREEGTLGAER